MTNIFTKRIAIKMHDNDKVEENILFHITRDILGSDGFSISNTVHKDEQFFTINLKNTEDAKKVYEECQDIIIEGTDVTLSMLVVPDELIFSETLITVDKNNVKTPHEVKKAKTENKEQLQE